MDITLIIALLALGAAVGFAAGLLGIGGGMLLVPFITMILAAKHFPQELVIHMAIATSLATIMFTSISSVRAHHARGAVLWRVVKLLAPGILIGSWIGPWIGAQMDSSTLAAAFGIFVAFSATQMLIDKKPAASRDLPSAPGMFGAGGVIGMLAGLVGAGGGFVSVPFMTWCNVRIHNAVATSAALGFPIALAGTLSNIYYGMRVPELPSGSLGYIYLPALLVISIGSVTTAPFGARTAHKLPVRSLKKVFAFTLYSLAAYMLYKALS
ncbi:sulfite exporter TauE/SafE family protein [Noviherbaspirillum cavernae]|uniref:Probable membrane transporter protein n=1 Tax=Noviherbaspirillum cavernae TaxID=2320862 RepID=A0A418WYN8_9BURK|nr:sulfite exporter TauE/SafE family protein [Noviherbaspirillum cavernae]RJG05369.1 sulfite exporter TauE/SafE family protein [Noviherbaspirillum cavernae]